MSQIHEQMVQFTRRGIKRRSFLRTVSATAALGGLGFRNLLAANANALRKEGRSLIVLWMRGGPSQFETFSPKPGESTGGPTKAISTAVAGIEVASGWEKTAKAMKEIAIVRSMTNREGNHQRASYQIHTGYLPSGSIKHPAIGPNIAFRIADKELEIPSVVSIGRTYGASYLGVDYDPFIVGNPGQLPANVATRIPKNRYRRRLGLMKNLEQDFAQNGGRKTVEDHSLLYDKASQMVLGTDVNAFDISKESDKMKSLYGNTNFGRGCLLARRLVESGVTYVEVNMNGWDTHLDNFDRVGNLAKQVDPGLAGLVTDLKQRGMLERTLVVWMGEFGRTPRVNARTGRDHYPRAFNIALAGGGVKGGQVIGKTNKTGTAVSNAPVTVNDLLCSVCHSVKVDPELKTMSPLGRPIKIVDGGKVVPQLFS